MGKYCCCWSVRLWYERWASIVVVVVVVVVVDKVGMTGRIGIVVAVYEDRDPVGASASVWTA